MLHRERADGKSQWHRDRPSPRTGHRPRRARARACDAAGVGRSAPDQRRGDKGYDTTGFVASRRALNVTPHVAQNERRPGGSAVDSRTTGWPGYGLSQRVRKRVEEIFGWIKTVDNFRRTRYRGVERTSFAA